MVDNFLWINSPKLSLLIHYLQTVSQKFLYFHYIDPVYCSSSTFDKLLLLRYLVIKLFLFVFRSSLTGCLALSTISLFVDRFRPSLQFCTLNFDKEAISDSLMAQSRVISGVLILSDFRELSFCGPCEPCFFTA